jgi:nudix-type nucleoside diphosphatase (YffH/AdpP family)
MARYYLIWNIINVNMKVVSQKTVYSGKLTVEQAILSHENELFIRERLKREDATAVLIYHREKKVFILTRQFRYAISDKTKTEILEIPAGKMDAGEEPLDCAIRETEEETGYRLRKEVITHIASCFVTPGCSAEKFHLFFATVTSADKVSDNSGVASDGEFIEIVEVDAGDLVSKVEKKELEDCKTLLAALWFIRNREKLKA